MELKDKVVVITGGSKGLGKAIASTFIAQQAKVIISARNKKELILASKSIKADYFTADVTKESEVKKLASFVKKKFKRIDIWVNNAGINFPPSSIEKTDIKKGHQIMEVNFWGTFYGAREALLIMKEQKRGTIVNIISTSALVGRPMSSIYSSSKWAARGFNEALREALETENISVIAIHPGGIKTTIFGNFKSAHYDKWMEPSYVAGKIVKNLKLKKPKAELVISH